MSKTKKIYIPKESLEVLGVLSKVVLKKHYEPAHVLVAVSALYRSVLLAAAQQDKEYAWEVFREDGANFLEDLEGVE